MADNGVFTKNADIAALAGVGANTTSVATAATDVYVLNVESIVNVDSDYNWSDTFAALDVDTKGVLTMAGACKCAMIVVSSDTDGYGSRQAETLLDFLQNTYDAMIKMLLDKDKTAFIRGEA